MTETAQGPPDLSHLPAPPAGVVPMGDLYVTQLEAGGILGVSRQRVQQMVESGMLTRAAVPWSRLPHVPRAEAEALRDLRASGAKSRGPKSYGDAWRPAAPRGEVLTLCRDGRPVAWFLWAPDDPADPGELAAPEHPARAWAREAERALSPPPSPPLLSLRQAARAACLDGRTMHKRVAAGLYPSASFDGRRWRLDPAEVERVRASPAGAAKPGGYERSWALRVTAWGETRTVNAWAKDPRCAVCAESVRQRLAKGWTGEAALATPPDPTKVRNGRRCRVEETDS